MQKPNHTKCAILGLLTFKPLTGYDLKKLVDEFISHFWKVRYTQIYKYLKELLNEGLVTEKKEEQSERPDKTIYSITKAGKAKLKEWVFANAGHPVVNHELLLKIAFHTSKDTPETLNMIENYKHISEELFQEYEQIKKDLLKCEKNERYYHKILLINFGLKITNAEVEWCKEATRILKSVKV